LALALVSPCREAALVKVGLDLFHRLRAGARLIGAAPAALPVVS